MTDSSAPTLDAIAFQLAASLEEYDGDVDRMVDSWLDMDLYQQVSARIEEIRAMSTALPQLSVPWAGLLIAHAELVHSLWRLRFQDVDTDRELLQQVRARHVGCVHTMRARCLRLLAHQRA